jgi:surface antigen
MKRILTILLVCLSFALFSQTIFDPAQIGQTGRNQCTSRGFWVKSDTALFTSKLWIPDGAGAGLVLTSDANGFATWQAAGSGSGWSLTGNAGTNPATNFIGTTDGVNFNIKANSAKQIEFSGDSVNFFTRIYFANGNTAFYELSDSVQIGDIVAFGDAESSSSGNRIEIKPNSTNLFDRFNLFTDSIIVINQAGINNYPFQFDVIDSVQSIYGHIKIVDGTQGAGKVLTSDANGLASWQGGIIYDSLTSLTGETVTLTNNSTYIIAASGTITDVTWSFPTGNTGDVLDIENMNVIVTLNITGVGTGTITAAKITNSKTAGLKTFHNYGGNWY